jgi:hypothetical protein
MHGAFMDGTTLTQFQAVLEAGYSGGKVPLLVLGAGISAGRVPLIKEIAEWLVDKLKADNVNEPILIRHGELIRNGQASRTEGAEFFSTLQDSTNQRLKFIWDTFCQRLVLGELELPNRQFAGLYRLTKDDDPARILLKSPSFAHKGIAAFLMEGGCRVLNLNYDPLLLLGMDWIQEKRLKESTRSPTDVNAEARSKLITLYTAQEVKAYFSSQDRQFQPSITNARGDVFYVYCNNTRCPKFRIDLSLDLHRDINDQDNIFLCPTCRMKSLKLQMAFPGYQTKEQLVQPVLEELWNFIRTSTSAVIVIGLSGQWDPYVLEAIFNWGLENIIPIIDVKPAGTKGSDDVDDPNLYFERFRARFFPSIPTKLDVGYCAYIRWQSTADDFISYLVQSCPTLGVVLPLSLLSETTQVARD